MSRSAAAREVEEQAIRRLLGHLKGKGESVTLDPRRPDEVDRSRPAVDFALQVGGDPVGVEITQLIPAARSHYEIAAFQHELKVRLQAHTEAARLGVVAVDLQFGALPSARAMRGDSRIVEGAIRDVMARLPSAPISQAAIPFDSGVQYITNAIVHQFPGNADVIGFITSSREWGGHLNPQAERFVDDLLSGSKPLQTAAWKRAWIVVVDRIGLVGPDLVAQSLIARRAEIPPNWERIYYLPASGEPITDVMPDGN